MSTNRLTAVLIVALVAYAAAPALLGLGKPQKVTIGPTAEVAESSSGLTFQARVDTGAAKTSVHFEDLVIEDESPDPAENIGKKAKVLLDDGAGSRAWVDTKIVDRTVVKMDAHREERYNIEIELSVLGVQKPALVTLNDRSRLKYPLLLGREYLTGDFVVDTGHVTEKVN
ncbi:hypothetical protein Mal64_18780 [Pseudobythopirellula maris]|uniref:Retropepsin-like aspartic endopeptidase domain-containing protein n=1 Tax=Pseudobythopirellula maris TaxID=2527991 RepID=A0A5C5ZML1_9BACT|nr:RimK/LysX family protein [Pseudobythopirellula maris]TWT88398.1 hypothetical protein Mal64_18780 [Pseudobythopirellula maris]